MFPPWRRRSWESREDFVRHLQEHHAHWRRLRHHRHRRHGLQRHLFMASGVAIGMTVLAVGLVVWAFGGAALQKDAARAETFLQHRFEAVWAEPPARAALVRSLADDMHMGVRTVGATGGELERAGELRRCHKAVSLAMRQGGRVEVCLDAHGFSLGGPLRGMLLIIVPGMVLWMVAGLWARRLARPLAELTAVARDLGDGKLERRARLRHGLSGEVGELTSAVNDMAARLEEKIRAERELLAGVSHELRTPLARVRILTELGREGALGSRDVWTELEVEVTEMDALVGELLASARVDFRALSLRPLDARAVAQQALVRHPGLRLEADEPGLVVEADATLLSRALGALLDNAQKHAGGATVLRVAARADRVAFEVDDAGRGFDPADLPRAFEPFYRGAGQAHDEARGVGLGLALVHRIAEAHGGRAWVENLPGGGARAGVELRRAGAS
jgi:two-component system OmpR family sensor kinase